MIDVLMKVHDAGEALVDVVCLAHEDLPERIAAIVLKFSTSVVCIEVDPDDDSLVVTGSPPKEPSGLAPLRGREPWEAAIGSQVLWAWRLVNHQGYGDGLQLAFCREKEPKAVIIQVLGEASSIDVFRVSRVQ